MALLAVTYYDTQEWVEFDGQLYAMWDIRWALAITATVFGVLCQLMENHE